MSWAHNVAREPQYSRVMDQNPPGMEELSARRWTIDTGTAEVISEVHPETGRPISMRRYDSILACSGEPWSIAMTDMDFVVACCVRLIKHDLPDTAYSRAFWDSALGALFKWIGGGAPRDITHLVRSTVNGSPHERDFERWADERNHRVAHPLGFGEVAYFAVGVDEETGRKASSSWYQFQKNGPQDDEIASLKALANELKAEFFAEWQRVAVLVCHEIAQLDDATIRALEPLTTAGLIGKHKPRQPGN